MNREEDCLYIVMPAYNEEAAICKVLEQWYPIIKRHHGGGTSRLLIVNDGSTDRTKERVEEFCQREAASQIICLTKENAGHGAAIDTGYLYALSHGADFVFQTDSDGQTNPDEFEGFWQKRYSYPMIMGYRKNRGDGLQRKWISHVERLMVAFFFGVNLADVNVPFRLMEAKSLREDLELIPRNAFLTNLLLAVACAKQNKAILYRSISFSPRAGGKSSIDLKRIIKIGWQSCREFRRINREISQKLGKKGSDVCRGRKMR